MKRWVEKCIYAQFLNEIVNYHFMPYHFRILVWHPIPYSYAYRKDCFLLTYVAFMWNNFSPSMEVLIFMWMHLHSIKYHNSLETGLSCHWKLCHTLLAITWYNPTIVASFFISLHGECKRKTFRTWRATAGMEKILDPKESADCMSLL